MLVLKVIFWVILILLVFFSLLLALKMWVKLEGHWRDNPDYVVQVGFGPFTVVQVRYPKGERERVVRIGGRAFAGTKVMAKPSFKDLQPFLNRDFLLCFFRTGRDILGRLEKNETTVLKGSWGFADPYYTGLMAAFLPLVPGTAITPVFSGECRDLEFKAGLRLRLGVVFYYGLRFLAARESRRVWLAVWKQKKEQKTRPKMQPSEKYGV